MRKRTLFDGDGFPVGFLVLAIAVWLIGALLSFALVGAIIWGIVQLVTHFT